MNEKYNLGLVSVTYRNHSPEEILKTMKDAGLEFIEWGSDVHAPYKEIEKIKEISRLQKEYNITCSSYGTYFYLGESDLSELKGYINAAKLLGTNIIRLWCGRKTGEQMTKEERLEFLDICKKAEQIAKEEGAILCMECHKNTFTQNPEDSVWLMEEINSPFFRMYWQPFQWSGKEGNIKNATMLSTYTKHIHVFNIKDGVKLPLDLAKDDWIEYLKCFSTPRTLLLEFMPNGTLEELKKEADTLKHIAMITEEK